MGGKAGLERHDECEQSVVENARLTTMVEDLTAALKRTENALIEERELTDRLHTVVEGWKDLHTVTVGLMSETEKLS